MTLPHSWVTPLADVRRGALGMRNLLNACVVTAALALAFTAVPVAVQARAAPAPLACADPAQPVNEERFVTIGGIEQWVTIRGDSCANPVILFLHGGPGNPLSPFASTIYAGWEKDFTLVQWDQRGAGRTFGRNPEPGALSLELMTGDGIELATWLRQRLGQDKVILMGGSWGSVLGVLMAKARPDLFHAYLGSGQLVDYAQNQAASYRLALARAQQEQDADTLAKLAAIGPPPWTNPRSFGALRRITRAYEARRATPPPAGWWTPAPAYATAADEAALEGGDDYSYLQFVGLAGDGMFSTLHLRERGADFAIPVFLIQGEEDLVTTPDVARAWFDFIRAPQKEYRLLPATGHDPNAAMVAAQYEILTTRIRPLVR